MFELRDKAVPFPWWTDVAYVGFYVLVLAALVAFFRPSLRTIGGQAILDGLLAVASLGLLWWGLVLRDLRLGSDPAALVGLSYPVLDLLLLCTIAATPLVSARRGTLAGWLVAAAVAVGGIADGVYAQLVLDDRYSSGRLVDLGWQLEAMPHCLAAVVAAFGIGRGPAWAQRRSPLRIRTAASMSVALIVILIVLVFESARATSRRRRRWGRARRRRAAARPGLAAPDLGGTRLGAPRPAHGRLRRAPSARPASSTRRGGRQYGEPFALVLMQVPRRHADEALGRLVGTARELDLVARLDDGRLAVVLVRISEPGAAEAAERLRAGIQTAATAGVALWQQPDTSADVFTKAEQLLDAAKQLGGNHARPAAGRPPPRAARTSA